MPRGTAASWWSMTRHLTQVGPGAWLQPEEAVGSAAVVCGGPLPRGPLLPRPPAHLACLRLLPPPLTSAGYQGAYGIVVEVESHPFDLGTMLFMDWRDDHLDATPDIKQRNAE